MEPPPRTFLIWGAGGHGRMVADLARACGHRVAGYVDRDPDKMGAEVDGADGRVFSRGGTAGEDPVRWRTPGGIGACALGIGDNRQRQRRFEELEPLDIPALIHPTASVSPRAHIGKGTVVFPHAVVNAEAFIEECVIVNSGAIIEHDCRLGAGAHISPGAVLCGAETVGDRAWVGAGATIIHGMRVGKDSIVGAGSTVIREIEESVKAVGSPAAVIGRAG